MKQMLLLFLFAAQILNASIILKEHEQWWEAKCNEKEKFELFAGWIGGEDELSRIAMRTHVQKKNYQSLLDIPCGLCVDYAPLKRNNDKMSYAGVDITPLFVERGQKLQIPVIQGKIQNIPFKDSSFEVAYSRHILEHLDTYTEAIKELVRVASKEVIIIFFIIPSNNDSDLIVTGPVDGYPIYHNRYSRFKIESFLNGIEKVKGYSWEHVPHTTECILHIIL